MNFNVSIIEILMKLVTISPLIDRWSCTDGDSHDALFGWVPDTVDRGLGRCLCAYCPWEAPPK